MLMQELMLRYSALFWLASLCANPSPRSLHACGEISSFAPLRPPAARTCAFLILRGGSDDADGQDTMPILQDWPLGIGFEKSKGLLATSGGIDGAPPLLPIQSHVFVKALLKYALTSIRIRKGDAASGAPTPKHREKLHESERAPRRKGRRRDHAESPSMLFESGVRALPMDQRRKETLDERRRREIGRRPYITESQP